MNNDKHTYNQYLAARVGQFSYNQEELDYNNVMQRATCIATGQLLPADIPIEDLMEDEDIRDLINETEVMIAPVLMHFQCSFRGSRNKYTLLSISLIRHPKHWKDNDVHHMPLEMHRFVDVYSDGTNIPTTIQHAETVEHLDRLVKNYARIYTLMGYEVSIPIQQELKLPSVAETLAMQAGAMGQTHPAMPRNPIPKPYPEYVLYRPHRDEERRIQPITSHAHASFLDNIHTAMTSKIGSKRGGINNRDKIDRLKELGAQFAPDDIRRDIYNKEYYRRSSMTWTNDTGKSPGHMTNP